MDQETFGELINSTLLWYEENYTEEISELLREIKYGAGTKIENIAELIGKILYQDNNDNDYLAVARRLWIFKQAFTYPDALLHWINESVDGYATKSWTLS